MAEANGATASPMRSQSQLPAQSHGNVIAANTNGSPNNMNGTHIDPTSSNIIPTDPLTSAADAGTSSRPRDARTIHMILSALGVSAYQERVPLQLLDFAYRYTAGILSDAQHLTLEGYSNSNSDASRTGAGADEISLDAVKLAASSRAGYQFTGGQLPKETLLEVAAERNKIRLPDLASAEPRFGTRLPHERFLLNGRNWSMEEEWQSAAGGSDSEEDVNSATNGPSHENSAVDGDDNDDEDMCEGQDAENGEGNYEDVFGVEEEEDNDKMEEG